MRRVSWKLIVLLVAVWPVGARGVDFTFVVWSDTHFRDYGGAYRDDAAQDILNLPGTPYPAAIGGTVGPIEFVLVTGDITQSSLFNQYQDSDGQTNDDFITHINYWFSSIPVYEVTGNHDSAAEPGMTQIRNAIAARHGGPSYSLDYQGLHFIGLDGWNSADMLSSSALNYLEAHMPTLNTQQAVIIFNHFPPQNPPNAQWDRVYNAIQGYNVILLCDGHEHYPRLGTWRGFDYLVTSDCQDIHSNQAFSVVHITDTELTTAAYDWANNVWRSDAILQKPISGVGSPWHSPAVVNPSFEVNGGSLDGWQIVRSDGRGPDDPPYDNDNPYEVHTPFGDHFAGKITNWGGMDFTMGQIIEVAEHDPGSTRVWWSLLAYAQMHCRGGETPYPANVHQRWEIGWNDDGSVPINVSQCDHYQIVADIDATYTGNDSEDFYPLSASGSITGVTGLQYVAFRVRLFVDEAKEWSLNNLDNVSFEATVVPPEPWIGVVPSSFQHTIWIRDSLANDTFTVANVGIGTLTYTITDDADDPDWLEMQPDTGDSQGEGDTINVIYDVAGLNAGEHLATITVTSPEAGNNPQTLAVSVVVETVGPDFDGDADVDQEDFGHLQACLSGAGITQTDPDCADADLDGDKDVDGIDFNILAGCMGPPDQPAEATCAND